MGSVHSRTHCDADRYMYSRIFRYQENLQGHQQAETYEGKCSNRNRRPQNKGSGTGGYGQ